LALPSLTLLSAEPHFSRASDLAESVCLLHYTTTSHPKEVESVLGKAFAKALGSFLGDLGRTDQVGVWLAFGVDR
jgi:hypothetical protein